MADCDGERSSIVIITVETNGINIVNGILEVENAVALVNKSIDKDLSWPWKIDNKYYTADIKINLIDYLNDKVTTYVKEAEAIIIYFDLSILFEKVSSYIKNFDDSLPEVKILVYDCCTNEELKNKILQYCINGGWELVELIGPEEETEEDELEDALEDSFGVQRIKQALHSHTWMNLKLKDANPSGLNSLLQCLELNRKEEDEEISYKSLQEEQNDEDELEGDFGEFGQLLTDLHDMKRKAANLPQNERKQYAEKVTLKFWKALGGNEDEIDLSEDEQETGDH